MYSGGMIMKKRILILTLCLAMLFITSCSTKSVITANTTVETEENTSEVTVEQPNFNCDKLCFNLPDFLYDNEKFVDRTLWQRLKILNGYYEKQENGLYKGYFNNYEGLMEAFAEYLDVYENKYDFSIIYNEDFDKTKLGTMTSAIISDGFNNNGDQIIRVAWHGAESPKPELDIEVIKELLNDPNVEYIYFYTPIEIPSEDKLN